MGSAPALDCSRGCDAYGLWKLQKGPCIGECPKHNCKRKKSFLALPLVLEKGQARTFFVCECHKNLYKLEINLLIHRNNLHFLNLAYSAQFLSLFKKLTTFKSKILPWGEKKGFPLPLENFISPIIAAKDGLRITENVWFLSQRASKNWRSHAAFA